MKLFMSTALLALSALSVSCSSGEYNSDSNVKETDTTETPAASTSTEKSTVCQDGIGSKIVLSLTGRNTEVTTRDGQRYTVKIVQSEVSGPALDTQKFPWAKTEGWLWADERFTISYRHARSDLTLTGRKDGNGIIFYRNANNGQEFEVWRFQNCFEQ